MLAVTSERTSNVIRAGWIPACAGMTRRVNVPLVLAVVRDVGSGQIPSGDRQGSRSVRCRAKDSPSTNARSPARTRRVRTPAAPLLVTSLGRAREVTRPPQVGGSLAWISQDSANRMDVRPMQQSPSSRAQARDPRSGDNPPDFGPDPGRVDSRLRGNDGKVNVPACPPPWFAVPQHHLPE